MHMQDLLQELKRDTDKACHKAIENRNTIPGAINWADLGCAETRFCENDLGEKYFSVSIEECSPDQVELYHFIAGELKAMGWSDSIEINFAW